MNKFILTAEEVALRIQVPVIHWKGNCYATACAMLAKKTPGTKGGKARYGSWLGPIYSSSMFWGKPIAPHHGWIEMPDKTIIDPTRYEFEGREPYVFHGPDEQGYYDIGSLKSRASYLPAVPPPAFNPDERQFPLPKRKGARDTVAHYLGVKPDAQPTICLKQAFYLAHLNPLEIPTDDSVKISTYLKKVAPAFIPMDVADLVFNP